MMIYKFSIQLRDTQTVRMPIGAQILTAQLQRKTICLWAIVDATKDQEDRVIEIFGTGHPMPPHPRRYIGTVQMDDGMFIWHVFERLTEPD